MISEVEILENNSVVEVLPAVSAQVQVFSQPPATTVEIVIAGPPGPRGSDGALTGLVTSEIPTGTIDGVNTDFTTAHNFSVLWVYLGGLRQQEDVDYTITGSNTFSFLSPPLTGMPLLVDYVES